MTDLIDAIGSRIASALWLARAAMQGQDRPAPRPARLAFVTSVGGASRA